MVARVRATAPRTALQVRVAAFRGNALGLAKTCSIGLRAGEYWARKTRERRRLGIPFKSRARPERFCNTLCQLSAHLRTRERSLLHVETGQADWVLTLGLAMTALVRPKCNIL